MVEDGVIIPGEPEWRVEAGRLEEVHVPPTLTGVLQARLDGLPEEERRALQGASVVGRVFWDRILEHINGALEDRITERGIADVLAELRARELIFQRETSAFAEAREHIFKHALLREVTYESVLKRVRKAYHALVAEWLTEHAGDRAGEFTGLIADHLELAGNESEACKYLIMAGKQAAGKYANKEAVGYLSRALNLTAETDPDKRYEILQDRAQVYGVLGNREAQEADIKILETIAEEMDNPVKQAETALQRAHYAESISDYQGSLQAAQSAVRIAQQTGNLEQEAAGYLAWGRALWRQPEYDQSNQKINQALELARRSGNQQLVGHALRHLGIIAMEHQQDIQLSNKYYQECLALHRKIGDRIGEALALNNLGVNSYSQLEFVQATNYIEATIVLCREIGFKLMEGVALSSLGEVHNILGEYQKAWNVYMQGLVIQRQLKDHLNFSDGLLRLGLIAVDINEDYQTARTFAEEGLSVAREIGNLLIEAFHLRLLAAAFTGLKKWSEAEELLEKSIEIIIKTDRQELIKYRWESLARLYMAQGLIDQAVQQVKLIMDEIKATEIKVQDFGVLRTLQTCCLVLNAASDPRFPQVLETAYNHLQNVAGKISDLNMRSSFLSNVPWNRGIIEMWEAEQEENKNPLIS